MQNLARFQTTSKFGGEYLRNGWRYSKLDKYILYHDSSCIGWKKFCELGDLVVKSYPPKSTFSEDHILAPKGYCTPTFLHALENDYVLLAHSRQGRRYPLQFFPKGVKNWLRMW